MSRDRKARLEKRRRRLDAVRRKLASGPARNLMSPRGPRVTVAEMQCYGYALCQRGCRGTGLERPQVACACATRRFLKAHPEVIVDPEANVWWPERRGDVTSPRSLADGETGGE